MIGTLPGPINWIFFIVILAVGVVCFRSNEKRSRFGFYALLISILGAWAATFFSIMWIHISFMIAALVICAFQSNTILLTVSAIYGVRIGIIGAQDAGFISEHLMWAWTEVPLLLQIILVLYFAMSDRFGSGIVHSNISRSSFRHLGVLQKRRSNKPY